MGLISRVSSRTYRENMIGRSLLRLQHPTKVQHVHFPAITTPMLPSGSYNGKTCLVTGGGTGLGFAMASRFAELGGEVFIASRQTNVLKEASSLINDKVGSEKVKYLKLDIKDTKMSSMFLIKWKSFQTW